MRSTELRRSSAENYLTSGHEHVLAKARPLFEKLIAELEQLPETASEQARLAAFEACVVGINEFEGEIETVERECFFKAFGSIATIVGLDPRAEFVERWRGDW